MAAIGCANDRHLSKEVLDGPEDGLPEASHEAVTRGIGEVDGTVADVAVAVPALRAEWTR